MYTVGIKRRFWFGYRDVRVNSHGWQDGRIILNLIDGSQEQIPGYAVYCLKVYNDFHRHAESVLEHQREKERISEIAKQKEEEEYLLRRDREELEALRQSRQYKMMAPEPEPIVSKPNPVPDQWREDMENEVLRRATKRTNELLT